MSESYLSFQHFAEFFSCTQVAVSVTRSSQSDQFATRRRLLQRRAASGRQSSPAECCRDDDYFHTPAQPLAPMGIDCPATRIDHRYCLLLSRSDMDCYFESWSPALKYLASSSTTMGSLCTCLGRPPAAGNLRKLERSLRWALRGTLLPEQILSSDLISHPTRQ